tara:strand:+ start:49446 stop:51776 length:2331 start_codon:yes stop_codon:yes gene_type:complete
VNISVSKNHQVVNTVDLSSEIEGTKGPISFFLGRGDDCHIQLDDMQISREHAKLTFNDNSWTIEKLSEFKEMSINGNATKTAILNNGDTVSIGPFLLTVNLPEVVHNDEANKETAEEEDGETKTVVLDDDDDDETALLDSDVALDDESLDEELGESLEDDLSDDLGDDLGENLDDDLGDDNLTEDVDEFADVDNELVDDAQDGEFAEEETFGDGEFAEEEGFGDGEFAEEEGFGEDGYDIDTIDDDDGSTKVLQTFAKIELRLEGEFAPYDKFVVEANETTIGRDPEKCAIVLNDPEVSGTHAVVKKTKISVMLEDLQSGNGTLLNGERINSNSLSNNDEFVIGSTTFVVHIFSDFLNQEQDRLMPVEDNQVVEVEEIVEVDTNFNDDYDVVEGGDGFGEATTPKSQSLFSKDALKDPEKRKKILIGLVVLLGLWTVLSDDTSTKKPAKKDDKKNSRLLKGEEDKKAIKGKDKKPLTAEQIKEVDAYYNVSKARYDEGAYAEALFELERIFRLTDDYKNAREIYEFSKEGLANLERIKRKEQEEREKRELALRVKDLVKKAEASVKERRVEYSESLFAEIMKLDPENFDVPKLKQDLEAYKQEQERIAIEKAQKKAERERQVQGMQAGKKFYLDKEWYKAISKLEVYLKDTSLDEDLQKEATKMLTESRDNLSSIVDPLVGKARSLKEGQDLKTAYETYKEIMKYDPNNIEAIEEMNKINETLTIRSKKVYREAIIAESLSLFEDAKEKFQEVQQISPTDSEYYKKATEKLKNFLE